MDRKLAEQQVLVIGGAALEWLLITSGVPQGSFPGLVLFII